MTTTKKCRHCGEEFPHTLEFFAPTQSKHKARHEQGPSTTCKPCKNAAQREYNTRRKVKDKERTPALMERKVWGRVEETPTKGGRIVRFGDDWRPTRDEKRYRTPGLLGYMSPLGSI